MKNDDKEEYNGGDRIFIFVLFNILIIKLKKDIDSKLILFLDVRRLGGISNMLEDRIYDGKRF